MSSPSFFSEGNTPRLRDTQWKVAQKILGAIIDQGAGFAPVSGTNYQFSGGLFKLKNVDTGLHNPIYTFGADGVAGVEVENGV